MKLLLHTCCAPCMIYPLEQLKKRRFEITGFFYNPNIHPFAEYKKRKQAAADFTKTADIKIIYPEYNPAEFFQAVNPVRNKTPKVSVASSEQISNGVALKEDRPERCSLCWSLRLQRTALTAKELGCNYFSTTLLVSPYQNQEELKEIGSDIAKEESVDFYFQDFRPGFKEARDEAKEKGIYRQNYCGCIYSEIERCKKSERH